MYLLPSYVRTNSTVPTELHVYSIRTGEI